MIDNLKSPKYKVKIPKTCSFPNPQNAKSKHQMFAVSQIPKIQCQKTEAHPPSMIDHLKSPKYNVKIPNVCSFPNPQNTMSKDWSPPPPLWSIISKPQNTMSKYQMFAVSQIPKIQCQKTEAHPPPLYDRSSQIPKIQSQNTKDLQFPKSPKYKVKIPKICSFPNPQNTKSKYQRLAVSQIPKIPQIPKKPRPL